MNEKTGVTENGRSWPVLAGPGRSWPVLAGHGRSWPVLAGPRKNKVSKLLQNIFLLNFEAKHTKGLKPFRAHSGYRNLLGVRGSHFTEEKVWLTGQDNISLSSVVNGPLRIISYFRAVK